MLSGLEPRRASSPNGRALRIAAVIPALRSGGAERVLTGLATELAARGHGVRIITLAPADEAPFYPPAGTVALEQLGLMRGATRIGGPATILRASRAIRASLAGDPPDLVLGFTTMGNVLALIATRRMGLPVIAAERVDPGGHRQSIGRFRALFRDQLYARADHIVVQTARARRALPWLPDSRVSIIPNPVPLADAVALPAKPTPDGRFRLIAAGRLERQKGFDLLLPAFGALAPRFPDWDLAIFGEGPERSNLEALIAKTCPPNRARLAGLSREIARELAAGHAFAFPSRFEGFPNALAEAMAAGLPAVAYEAVSGVEELIIDGQTGLIATWRDPIASLTSRFATLMADAPLRTHLGEAARAHVVAYDPKVQYDHWERLLGMVAQRHL